MTQTNYSDGICTDTTLNFAQRDGYLDGLNSGGAHLFDLTKAISYPTQAVPTSGVAIKDIAWPNLGGVDGSAIVQAGAALAWSGKGFSLAGVLSRLNGVIMPGGPLASLFAQQLVGHILYLKMPAEADWPTVAGKFIVFYGTDAVVGANTDPQVVQMAFVANGTDANRMSLWIRWQLDNAGNYVTLQFPKAEIPFGELTQVSAFTLNAVGGGRTGYGRLRSATKDNTRSAAIAAKNILDFSAAKMACGRVNAVTALDASMPYTIYRGAWENIAVTGRVDQIAVQNADWTRVQSRITSNAEANGGVSQIFA